MKNSDTRSIRMRSLDSFLQVGMHCITSATLLSLHTAWEAEKSVCHRHRRRPVGCHGPVARTAIKMKFHYLKRTSELTAGPQKTIHICIKIGYMSRQHWSLVRDLIFLNYSSTVQLRGFPKLTLTFNEQY